MPDRGSDTGSSDRRQGTDVATLNRHFGTSESVLPMWIAEPSIELASGVSDALRARAESGWYGYEPRPESIVGSFWDWMSARHGWDGSGLRTLISPSVGTSIGVLIEELTRPGDGVIIQPPVFTDFKTLITSSGRTVIQNPLALTDAGYRIDFADLATKASDPTTKVLVLCSPHNPVGRVWTPHELAQLASICAERGVFVIADEIHADLALAPHEFVPFAAASGTDVSWAAVHGPIKTFGLAGVCDTLLITANEQIADRFESRSSNLRLTRNNVFGLAAFEAAYRSGAAWLDGFLELIAHNVAALEHRLPDGVALLAPEGTYLAWLDLNGLGLEVPEIPNWLASQAGLALSPGHWFGRQGAGFARMTIAAPSETIERAADQLTAAVARLR
jgi:cystathionine beta-lyase